jgi:hypothetical protein
MWIIERNPNISNASYELPITLIFRRHENHLGWIDITNLMDAKEIFLTEGHK